MCVRARVRESPLSHEAALFRRQKIQPQLCLNEKDQKRKKKKKTIEYIKDLPACYLNKYLYMRKNTPVYCRLNLYGNLRDITGD